MYRQRSVDERASERLVSNGSSSNQVHRNVPRFQAANQCRTYSPPLATSPREISAGHRRQNHQEARETAPRTRPVARHRPRSPSPASPPREARSFHSRPEPRQIHNGWSGPRPIVEYQTYSPPLDQPYVNYRTHSPPSDLYYVDYGTHSPYATHEEASHFQQWRQDAQEIATERMRFQVGQYPRALREYIQPAIHNEYVMRRVGETLHRFDEDDKYLAHTTGVFLSRLQSITDEPDGGTELGSEDSGWSSSDEDSDDDGRRPSPARRSQCGSEPKSNDFMHWAGYNPHAISRDTDILGDRRKSSLALWQAIELSAGSPIGNISVKGLFGVFAKVLTRKDYRAYYKAAAARIIFLPESNAAQLTESDLEDHERNLLGTSHYLGSGSSQKITCITYASGYSYGTITLFEVNLTQVGREYWPERIRPVSLMKKVPKEILIKTANTVPRSQRTVLQVKSRKSGNQLQWTSRSSNSSSKSNPPSVERSLGIQLDELSRSFQCALAINPNEESKHGEAANAVRATIPEMLAWLHARTSYLKEIKIDGIEFRKDRSSIQKIAWWKEGPEPVAHEGKDPCIVVLHPDQCIWASARLYWR